MLSRIKQIAIVAADLESSKEFYRDKLGMKLLFEAPPGLAFFDCDGIMLMVAAANEREPARPGSVLYFGVEDIYDAYSTLKERGVPFVDEPHRVAELGNVELWMSFFRDPDGTVLAIRAEVPKQNA